MFKAHREQLRSKRVALVRDLVVDEEFLSVFLAEDLFTEAMCEEILVCVHSKPLARSKLSFRYVIHVGGLYM